MAVPIYLSPTYTFLSLENSLPTTQPTIRYCSHFSRSTSTKYLTFAVDFQAKSSPSPSTCPCNLYVIVLYAIPSLRKAQHGYHADNNLESRNSYTIHKVFILLLWMKNNKPPKHPFCGINLKEGHCLKIVSPVEKTWAEESPSSQQWGLLFHYYLFLCKSFPTCTARRTLIFFYFAIFVFDSSTPFSVVFFWFLRILFSLLVSRL